MRRLACFANDPEDVGGGEVEDRQPVKPFSPRAGVSVATFPGTTPGAVGALVPAQSHGADQAALEAGVGLQVAAQLAFDRRNLGVAGTESCPWAREHAPFLDAFEKRLPGRHAREYQRNARRHGVLDVLDRARPLDLAERGVNHHQLVAGDDPGAG